MGRSIGVGFEHFFLLFLFTGKGGGGMKYPGWLGEFMHTLPSRGKGRGLYMMYLIRQVCCLYEYEEELAFWSRKINALG